MREATIEDVAREAGVSITTVSRTINKNYPVSEKARRKVEAAVKKLGYTPNELARGLIQKKTETVGVLTPSLTNLFFPLVVDGIQRFFKEKGYQILLCNTGGEAEEEEKYLRKLTERRVDGIISLDPRTAVIQSGCYNQAAVFTPLVLVNGYNRDIKLNFVLNDQASGAMEAMNYLFSLGHREIAFIRGKRSYSGEVKETVYRQALEKHGIPFREDRLILLEHGNRVDTIDLSDQAVAGLLRSEAPPTAIFAANDWMAVGALYAAQKSGLRVPEDVSVIGYDNSTLSEITMPRLTTVDQNMQRLGRTSAEYLFRQMEEGAEGYFRVVLDTKLVIRNSCAPVNLKA